MQGILHSRSLLAATESLKALGGLGLLSLGAKYILRRVFEVVADTRSSEAFVALCLLTIAGISLGTQNLGFSDTLGAFLAGAILAETNFRTQIEADIRPFRGLLLGLFFLTTGTSIDMQLSKFVASYNRLGVLPLELNKLLIIVVVLSMALTPFLNEAGRRAASFIEEKSDSENNEKALETVNFNAREPVVILGFGQMGQVLANFLSNPLASGEGDEVGWPYVAFDVDPNVVKTARKIGFPIVYGDGSRPDVLQSAGVSSPKAFMIMYTGKKKTIDAVQRLRLTFPAIPIYARARDLKHLLDLKKSGATDAILENAETSLHLGSKLLKGLGVMSDDVAFLSQLIRDSMELQAQEAVSQPENRGLDIMQPLQGVEVSVVKGEAVRLDINRVLLLCRGISEYFVVESSILSAERGYALIQGGYAPILLLMNKIKLFEEHKGCQGAKRLRGVAIAGGTTNTTEQKGLERAVESKICLETSWGQLFCSYPLKLEVGRCDLAQAWKSCHRKLILLGALFFFNGFGSSKVRKFKVKASDLREVRVPAAITSPESELSEMNQKDEASAVRNQREVDPEEQKHELSEAVKLEGNGVLLSKQISEENVEEP
ncbi:hypothetical protein V8G54_001633 [Vigna mungo]|uniref:RCK N-terminal domain-containing protein n=1 Tax=Vigna mungo TaxID=3915 RepID=A0AAQ3SC03_VIGMU